MSGGLSPYLESADIETSSDGYAGRFSGKVGEWFLEVQKRITLDLLAPYTGERVLEVGGGHAQLAPALVEAGYDLTVTGSADVCRERLDRFLEPGSFEYLTCDMLELPFADDSFEVVMAFRLLPHVDRWPRLLAEMCRVAKDTVIVDYPDLRSFNYFSEGLFKAKMAVEKNTRTFKCFWRGEVLGELAANHFGEATLKPQFFWPMALHRAVGSTAFSRASEGAARVLGLTRLLGSPVILKAVNLSPTFEPSGE